MLGLSAYRVELESAGCSPLVWDNAHPASALIYLRADQQPDGNRHLYPRD